VLCPAAAWGIDSEESAAQHGFVTGVSAWPDALSMRQDNPLLKSMNISTYGNRKDIRKMTSKSKIQIISNPDFGVEAQSGICTIHLRAIRICSEHLAIYRALGSRVSW
jgi:hypothetical protein